MKPKWSKGDLFLIRNLDHRFTPCQILGYETRTLHSAACAFFDQRLNDPSEASLMELRYDRCFSTLLVTPDLLNNGIWPICGPRRVVVPSSFYPHGRILMVRQILRFFDLEQSVFTQKLGMPTIHGSGIVMEFLDAFYGLRAWDDWHSPDYLDGFLLTPDKKPKNLIYCGRHE